MDIFDVLSLIGGLCLFLFGMNIMGEALEKRAGGGLNAMLSRLTTGRLAGFLTGLGVTAVIQSSSATTVMVVGFVNSGLMSLRQAINVIMGANVGTTVTSWLLSLTGIASDNVFIRMLKPSSFTPILALIGIILYMAGASGKRKDVGMILLGFATLMFGMETMSSAVSGLRDVPGFQNILTMFSNPLLGVLAGAVLTAIIQSSSASVGILQALAGTGSITFGAAIPIIMGQNIGTCVTAIISSIGANRNARRAAAVHLCFNIIGTVVWLSLFCAANAIFHFSFVTQSVDAFSIAIVHTVFNVLCTALMLPLSGVLEKLACKLIPDPKEEEALPELDERLLATPAIAIERCREVAGEMANGAADALKTALKQIDAYNAEEAEKVRITEVNTDQLEDKLGTYLVRLSSRAMSDRDSAQSAKLLHVLSDLERISDHAVNIVDSVTELNDKQIEFSDAAKRELHVLCEAVNECIDLALRAFLKDDMEAAREVVPLEEVVGVLKNQLRIRHVMRLQHGECSIEAGFVLTDLLTSLERVSGHCSNIGGCVIEISRPGLDMHKFWGSIRTEEPEYLRQYNTLAEKYALV